MVDKREPVEPFAEYIEWTEHRYDPGYYLGGRIPPYLRRASLGRSARLRASFLLLVFGLMFAVPALWGTTRQVGWQLLGFVAFSALMFGAALRMYPWKRRSRRSSSSVRSRPRRD